MKLIFIGNDDEQITVTEELRKNLSRRKRARALGNIIVRLISGVTQAELEPIGFCQSYIVAIETVDAFAARLQFALPAEEENDEKLKVIHQTIQDAIEDRNARLLEIEEEKKDEQANPD